MSIRKKIIYGCLIIAFIFFLAGFMVIFEMQRIRSSVSVVFTENVKSMNAANNMQRLIDRQNMEIFNYISTDKDSITLNTLKNDIKRYEASYDTARSRITIDGEQQIIDSLNVSYAAYRNVIDSLVDINGFSRKHQLYGRYFNQLYSEYNKISELINNLFLINQRALEQNSLFMDENYYRMIMPAIIAILAGIILIFLFNYFVNLYLIKPTKHIARSLDAYTSTRVPYNVNIETNDEMAQINNEIKKLTELVKKYESEK